MAATDCRRWRFPDPIIRIRSAGGWEEIHRKGRKGMVASFAILCVLCGSNL